MLATITTIFFERPIKAALTSYRASNQFKKQIDRLVEIARKGLAKSLMNEVAKKVPVCYEYV